MKIKTWNKDMSDAESKDLAYWERNMLALYRVRLCTKPGMSHNDLRHDIKRRGEQSCESLF